MEVVEDLKIDLIPQSEPALSARSDIPVVETKPDSKPAEPEKKPETEVDKDSAAPPEEEGKKAEESAPSEEPEDPPANTEVEGKPKAKGVQKRIDELVKQREEERAEKLRLMALLEEIHKPKQEPKEEAVDEAPQRPTRESFPDPEAYAQALAEYADQKASWSAKEAVREALAEERTRREQEQAERAQQSIRDAYNSRVQKVTEKYPDYKAVAESPEVTVSIPMAQAILTSDHGPEIQYFLGKNPTEAQRISSLPPVNQLVELGLIVAKLTAAEPAPAAPAPKPAVSSAPKPIKPLETSKPALGKSPDEESMEEYAARRTKELQAERGRPGVRH